MLLLLVLLCAVFEARAETCEEKGLVGECKYVFFSIDLLLFRPRLLLSKPTALSFLTPPTPH